MADIVGRHEGFPKRRSVSSSRVRISACGAPVLFSVVPDADKPVATPVPRLTFDHRVVALRFDAGNAYVLCQADPYDVVELPGFRSDLIPGSAAKMEEFLDEQGLRDTSPEKEDVIDGAFGSPATIVFLASVHSDLAEDSSLSWLPFADATSEFCDRDNDAIQICLAAISDAAAEEDEEDEDAVSMTESAANVRLITCP
jgi:hypothetical protein